MSGPPHAGDRQPPSRAAAALGDPAPTACPERTAGPARTPDPAQASSPKQVPALVPVSTIDPALDPAEGFASVPTHTPALPRAAAQADASTSVPSRAIAPAASATTITSTDADGTHHAVRAPDVDRLRRLLGTPELGWLLQRTRRRLEHGQPLDTSVSRTGPSEAERAAVARLLGRPLRPGRSLSVPLPAVDEVLRRSGAAPGGLTEAVVLLTGPVTDRHNALTIEIRAWDNAFAPLRAATAAHRAAQALTPWCEQLRTAGLVRRLAGGSVRSAASILADLARVVAALPADPPRSLAAFGAEQCGDAHALDDDRPLSTLARRAVQAITGAPDGVGAQWRRDTWASAGLLRDELSSQVLALGLPGDTTTATGRALGALREAGQPAVLTLRQLVRDTPRPGPAGNAYVCENPAVVEAAADRLGSGCPTLICLRGRPSAAAVHLLRLLHNAGWILRYHGDFDWGGVRIAAGLLPHVPWSPWRYTAAEYQAACVAHPATTPLTGPPAATPWDPALHHVLIAEGQRIEEELLLDTLLADLADGRADIV